MKDAINLILMWFSAFLVHLWITKHIETNESPQQSVLITKYHNMYCSTWQRDHTINSFSNVNKHLISLRIIYKQLQVQCKSASRFSYFWQNNDMYTSADVFSFIFACMQMYILIWPSLKFWKRLMDITNLTPAQNTTQELMIRTITLIN